MAASPTMAGSARPSWTDHPERRYQFASGKGDKPKGEPYVGNELEDEFMREFYLRYDPTSRHANNYVYHRQWWMNMAYFLGMHWLQFSGTTGFQPIDATSRAKLDRLRAGVARVRAEVE